jgi:UDP-N-acetylmuramate--alanine ligase
MARIEDRRIVTYGFSPQADVRAENVEVTASGERFDVVIHDPHGAGSQRIDGVELAMRGRHNVSNALAAIAIASELKIAPDRTRAALGGLKGVKRRFTEVGSVQGIDIIDDYGHHPIEIRAVLETARKATKGRVIAVVQPHRYTRLHDLFEEFCGACGDADIVIVAPVYAAGESPIEDADHTALAQGMIAQGQRQVETIESEEELAPLIADLAEPGDMVVCLGAGSITLWAHALPAQLEPLLQGAS